MKAEKTLRSQNSANPTTLSAMSPQRQKEDKDDEHVGWVITFADLMTILLFFSFFMHVMVNRLVFLVT